MSKRILVVDDEPDIVEVVKTRLEMGGYEVITASNGPEGLKAAKEGKPDLLLLDVSMPGMDGFEVLTKLKADPDIASIPVIMLTAKSEFKYIEKAQELKVTDYIIKPFKSDELLRWVNKYIRGSSVSPPLL